MLEPSLDVSLWVMLCGAGLIAGFIDAVAGGGGLLTVPALLSAGLPPHIALGTNKLAATFASSTASWTYYKKKLFDPIFWKRSFIATAFGAILGTLFVDWIPAVWLERILPLVILFSAIYTLLNRTKPIQNEHLPAPSGKLHRQQWLQGSTLGFYDGVAGPGTGAFWTVSSMALYKLDILLASGVARTMNFVSNACSLLTFFYLGHINIALGMGMGLFLMLGAYIGAHSAIRFGASFIRPVFITVVLLIALKLAYQAWV